MLGKPGKSSGYPSCTISRIKKDRGVGHQERENVEHVRENDAAVSEEHGKTSSKETRGLSHDDVERREFSKASKKVERTFWKSLRGGCSEQDRIEERRQQCPLKGGEHTNLLDPCETKGRETLR